MTTERPQNPDRATNDPDDTPRPNGTGFDTGLDTASEAASDAAIIVASLTEPEAFGNLFDRHGVTLLRYLTRRVGRNDAEDLLGETFRIAFETRARFDGDRSDSDKTNARPWLYGIAANLVLKRHRSTRRRDRATERLHALPALHVVPDLAEHIVDASVNRELLAKVANLIDELPDDFREALVLFAWEGLDYAQIADALGIPIGTVRSRQHRIRVRIRELDDRIGQEPDTSAAAKGAAATTPEDAPR